MAETKADLDNFQSYKITAAKDYLLSLKAVDILNELEIVKSELNPRLNPDPLIAMAQINELFVRIDANQIVVPKGYAPPSTSLFSGWFASCDQSMSTAHTKMLNLLKKMYTEKLSLLVEQAPEVEESKQIGFGSKQGAQAVLKEMIDSHEVSQFCDGVRVNELIQEYEATLREDEDEEFSIS